MNPEKKQDLYKSIFLGLLISAALIALIIIVNEYGFHVRLSFGKYLLVFAGFTLWIIFVLFKTVKWKNRNYSFVKITSSKFFKQFLIILDKIRFVFIGALFLAIISNFAGISIVGSGINTALHIAAYTLGAMAWISIFLSKDYKINKWILFIIPLLILLLPSLPYRIFFIISFFLLFMRRGYGYIATPLLILTYFIFSILTLIFLIMSNYGKIEVTKEYYSPDKKYRVVVIDNDKGVFGGSTIVSLEEFYFGFINYSKKDLYIGNWGENPDIKWINNEIVQVNGIWKYVEE